MFVVDAGGIALTERVKRCEYDTQAHMPWVAAACDAREQRPQRHERPCGRTLDPEPASSFDHSCHAWPNRDHQQEKLQCGWRRKECASGVKRCQLGQRALLLLCAELWAEGQQRAAGSMQASAERMRAYVGGTELGRLRRVKVWCELLGEPAATEEGRRPEAVVEEGERHGVLRERVCVCVSECRVFGVGVGECGWRVCCRSVRVWL